SIHDGQPLPDGLAALLARGVPVVPHGVRLSLGSAEAPDPGRVANLARLAERLAAPLVSEHVAFVRGGGLEAGHLLPVPRTRDALDVLVRNVRLAQAELPVPLALEHVAALLEWPAPELDEAAFLAGLLERPGGGSPPGPPPAGSSATASTTTPTPTRPRPRSSTWWPSSAPGAPRPGSCS